MTPELRALLAEATAGPWFWPHWNALAGGAEGDPDGEWELVLATAVGQTPSDADAALIVALRNHAEALLDLWEAASGLFDEGAHGYNDARRIADALDRLEAIE